MTLASLDLSSEHQGMDFALSQVALAAASLAAQQAAQDGAAVRPPGADSGGMAAMGHEGHSNAPARDGNVAIREELEMARKARTVAAYDLFIARHPRHPLNAVARLERETLLAKKGGPAKRR
jgi:hypothetical protein